MEEIIDKLAHILEEIEGYHGVVKDLSTHRYVAQLHLQAKEHVAELRKIVADSKLIETQAEYIRKQGFLSYVIPPLPDGLPIYTIHIRKMVAGQIVGVDWAISQTDLRYLYVSEILREQADERMAMMRRAIAEREERK